MSLTVRIDPATHATLKDLADRDRVTLQEELARAVEAYRRDRFFAEMAQGFASLSPAEQAEDLDELRAWDGTLTDGLEAE